VISRTVLVVNHDPDFAQQAADMLRAAGAEAVSHASGCDAALAQIATGGADIVLCDLDRPSHEGAFLIRMLAERRHSGRVIALCGETDPAMDAIVRLARHQGLAIEGPLRKPLRLDDLRRALNGGAAARGDAAPAAMPSLLEAAISQGGLHPFFQPKVRMTDGRISGAEALARIATPQAQYANPAPYVALAERNSRIDALTFAMTCAVARYASGFVLDGMQLPVSINISPVSLERADFPDMMTGAVEAQGLACASVTLEVTDGRPEQYGPNARAVMERLRAAGFGLAIDDFGAGHANLDRLGMYPFSEVKIDAVLTRHALEETYARKCLEESVKLARDLGLNVVAEGVETIEMWRLLESLGVHEAQGFLLSKPAPASALMALLAQGADLGVRAGVVARAKSA
jgi:EAL domain-containing protein (putative c-di-GMP-specific phosphodiesterase class I)/CheY-like chemotaxis protein